MNKLPPKEHTVVTLLTDYAGLPKGSAGTVVHVYGPEESEVAVEFARGNVLDIPCQNLDYEGTPITHAYLPTDAFVRYALTVHQKDLTKSGKRYTGHLIRVREAGKTIARKAIAADPEIFDGFQDLETSGLTCLDKVEQTCIGHDLLEDHPDEVTVEKLQEIGVHPHVIDGIQRMTKNDGEKYPDAVERAKGSPFSRIGKMADNSHNSQLTRVGNLTEPVEKTIARHTKYLLSYCYLIGRITKAEFEARLGNE